MKLLKFYTDTCQPCRLMAPIVEQVCETLGVPYESIHALEDKRGADFEIKSVPTLVLLDDSGKEVSRKAGLTHLKDLKQWIQEYGV